MWMSAPITLPLGFRAPTASDSSTAVSSALAIPMSPNLIPACLQPLTSYHTNVSRVGPKPYCLCKCTMLGSGCSCNAHDNAGRHRLCTSKRAR